MNRRGYEVIVIGAGLAGIFAALSAKHSQNKVLLIGKGFGSFYYGPGVIDLLGSKEGAMITNSWEESGHLPMLHPYKILGENRVRQGVKQFLHQMEAAGYPFIFRDNGENLLLPTALGSIRPTYLAPLAQAQGDLEIGGKIKLLGVEGFYYFSPRLAAANLSKALNKRGKENEITWGMLQLGVIRPGPISAYDLALWLDHPGHVGEMLKQLLPQLGQEERIGFPAILGLANHRQVLARIEEAAGRRVFEIPTIPPSVPGIRLHQILSMLIREQGIDCIITGYPAAAVERKGDFVHCVQVAAPGKNISYQGEKFILATGGLGSAGLVSGPGWVREPLFNLPVYHHQEVGRWSTSNILEEQPYACFGIRVDQKMGSLDAQGQLCYVNLHAVGSILAHFDGVAEKSAGGVDIATGFIAGKVCGGEG